MGNNSFNERDPDFDTSQQLLKHIRVTSMHEVLG